MKFIAPVLVILGSIALAGCSSGGSSTVTPPPVVKPVTQFTSMSALEDGLKPGETITLPGVSRESKYTVTSDFPILGEASAAETGASVAYTGGSGADGEPTLVITSAKGTKIVFKPSDDPNVFMARTVDVGFNTGSGTFSESGSPFIMDFTEPTNGITNIHFSTEYTLSGWDYQNFGVWITNFGGTSGEVGAMTSGALTSAANLPTTGDATFAGLSAGVFVDVNGDGFATASKMTATTSFANRTVSFDTTSTTAAPLDLTVNALINRTNYAYTATPELNLTGTMSYAAGTNNMSGQVSSANGMTGVVDANFFGPTANEIGGSFAARGDAGYYIGAFGGKR